MMVEITPEETERLRRLRAGLAGTGDDLMMDIQLLVRIADQLWAEMVRLEEQLKSPLFLSPFEQSGLAVGALVAEKNAAYGDAFAKCGAFLRLLYPDGIRPEQYSDALCLVRMWDKMCRIATDRGALGKSPYQDIAGYGLLGMALSRKGDPDGGE